MKEKNKPKKLFVSFALSYLMALPATTTTLNLNPETQQAVKNIGANGAVEVIFTERSTRITEDAKQEIANIMTETRLQGDVAEVRIATWADQEYPAEGVSLSKNERDLAKDRGNELKRYLQKEYNIDQVSVYSMAERPTSLEQVLRTDEAQSKTTLESTGSAPTTETQKGFRGLKGKASRALIMVFNKQ